MPAGRVGSTSYSDDLDGYTVRPSNTGRDGRVTLGGGFSHVDETFYESPRRAPDPRTIDDPLAKQRPKSRGRSRRR